MLCDQIILLKILCTDLHISCDNTTAAFIHLGWLGLGSGLLLLFIYECTYIMKFRLQAFVHIHVL